MAMAVALVSSRVVSSRLDGIPFDPSDWRLPRGRGLGDRGLARVQRFGLGLVGAEPPGLLCAGWPVGLLESLVLPAAGWPLGAAADFAFSAGALPVSAAFCGPEGRPGAPVPEPGMAGIGPEVPGTRGAGAGRGGGGSGAWPPGPGAETPLSLMTTGEVSIGTAAACMGLMSQSGRMPKTTTTAVPR